MAWQFPLAAVISIGLKLPQEIESVACLPEEPPTIGNVLFMLIGLLDTSFGLQSEQEQALDRYAQS